MPELNEANLKKLEKMLAVMDEDTLTRAEFSAAFEKVVELVLKIQKEQSSAISKLEATYQVLLDRMRNDHEMTYADMRKSVDKLFVGEKIDGMTKEHLARMVATDKKLAEAEAKIRSLKDGKEGMPGPRGFQGSPDTADQVVRKINSANGLIEQDKVRGLSELQKKVDLATKMESRRVFAGPSANSVQFTDLSSQLDGSTKTFNTPKYRHALLLVGTQFPILFRPTTDFTLGNGKITLTAEVSAPATGQSLVMLYIK